MPVIDASVYVALINANEKAHDQSWQWFQAVIKNEEALYAPAIILPEVAAAISRGTGDPNLAHEIVDQLKDSRLITLQPITQVLAKLAAKHALKYKIRGCDAVYVALADQMETALITLDKQQLARGRRAVETRAP
jgi:predicted nucleic acid-binding protein